MEKDQKGDNLSHSFLGATEGGKHKTSPRHASHCRENMEAWS